MHSVFLCIRQFARKWWCDETTMHCWKLNSFYAINCNYNASTNKKVILKISPAVGQIQLIINWVRSISTITEQNILTTNWVNEIDQLLDNVIATNKWEAKIWPIFGYMKFDQILGKTGLTNYYINKFYQQKHK